jgi:tRNA 2-thiouridine synthesizing protein C
MTQRSTLVILSSSPYGSSQAKEALDFVLAAGTFEQNISFLLQGDGCYLLNSKQNPDGIQQKNISQMIKALPIYGVESILVNKNDAESRNIPLPEAPNTTQALDNDAIKTHIQNADAVLRF